MTEKQWYWVFHIKGQPSRQYPVDEVESVKLSARELMLTIVFKDERLSYYPLESLNSWHKIELLKRDAEPYKRMRMGAY
jgi:hypothetical protein